KTRPTISFDLKHRALLTTQMTVLSSHRNTLRAEVLHLELESAESIGGKNESHIQILILPLKSIYGIMFATSSITPRRGTSAELCRPRSEKNRPETVILCGATSMEDAGRL
ncbi:hypothetical protein LDO31_00005, partial [Luteimonas sp. XNQY3]